MSITTPVTDLLGINHPILLAPMDLVADGRLVAAVDAAGGFGILGGGYGEEKWLVRELDLLDRSKARFGYARSAISRTPIAGTGYRIPCCLA